MPSAPAVLHSDRCRRQRHPGARRAAGSVQGGPRRGPVTRAGGRPGACLPARRCRPCLLRRQAEARMPPRAQARPSRHLAFALLVATRVRAPFLHIWASPVRARPCSRQHNSRPAGAGQARQPAPGGAPGGERGGQRRVQSQVWRLCAGGGRGRTHIRRSARWAQLEVPTNTVTTRPALSASSTLFSICGVRSSQAGQGSSAKAAERSTLHHHHPPTAPPR